MFNIPIPALSYVLMGLAFALIILSVIYGLKPICLAIRPGAIPSADVPDQAPKASVIIYTDNDSEKLEYLLDAMTREDYPDFEIIVVYDAPADYARMLNERFSKTYGNVYVTFIPPGSHNISRRKLAITSGVKASKGEIIVTTTGDVVLPNHHHWLSSLLAPFCGQNGRSIDVSLGLSQIKFADFKGWTRWYRQFDSILSDAQWIGYALMGKTYRGDGNNLAFRRSTFLDHKGYAKTINLHNGDDDLFINEISTGANTAVVTNPESQLVTEWPQGANRVWSNRKEGYNFTARWLPKQPFMRYWCQKFLQWLIPASIIAAFVIALPNLLMLIIGAALLIIFWGLEIFLYRRLASRYNCVRLWWAVVPFWMFQPIADIWFDLAHRETAKQNFTWLRKG